MSHTIRWCLMSARPTWPRMFFSFTRRFQKWQLDVADLHDDTATWHQLFKTGLLRLVTFEILLATYLVLEIQQCGIKPTSLQVRIRNPCIQSALDQVVLHFWKVKIDFSNNRHKYITHQAAGRNIYQYHETPIRRIFLRLLVSTGNIGLHFSFQLAFVTA